MQEDSAIAVGNHYKEPKFKQGFYELAQYSPAIGQGIDSVQIDGNWYFAPSNDLLGNVRPNPIDPYIDLGAYESDFLFTSLTDLQTKILKFYPNPFSTFATLELEGDNTVRRIEIFNMMGETVRIMDQPLDNSVTIHRKNLPSGIYFLKIHSDETYVIKVLIE